jgi:predicted transcriptional regulator
MPTIQIQLSDELFARLKQLAHSRGCSIAQVVREAVDHVLRQDPAASPRELRACAAAVSGRFRSGLKDLSNAHDRYLAEDYGS